MAAFAATGGVQAQTIQPCDCEDLDTDITAHTTLTEDCYFLQGCVRVTTGFSLSIPAGTVIFADANAELQVERGAWLNVNGAGNSPVVFTSAQLVSNRTPGYWKGITIAGNGINNVNPGSTITLLRNSCNLLAGGSDNADSSGELRHVQIHYAGGQGMSETDVNGLTLACAGSGTIIENVQVTHSLTNGFSFIGGAVNVKYAAGYNNYQTDFRYDRGYTGMGQFLVSLRMDPSVYDAGAPAESNGILVENNSTSIAFSGTPETHPVLSNVSIFGPRYCDEETNTGTIVGVTLRGKAEIDIYNSFVSGYPTGLFILDTLTIENAHNELINFGYSSFYRNVNHFVSDPANFDPNSDFCVNTIADWMIDNGIGCEEPDNEILALEPEYHGSICNESYCGSGNRPTFVLTTNNMLPPDFDADALADNFFIKMGIGYRGALGSTDWTENWTDWCPIATDYCPEQLYQRKTVPSGKLNIAPNPAGSTAYALFDVSQTGKAIVNVLDKVSGQVLQSSNSYISAPGAQRITIPVNGLQTGIYVVKVTLPDGSILTGQLSVR